MIKLIAIDLDGTLLTDEKTLTSENICALQEANENGIQIVISTGRTLPGVRRFLSQLSHVLTDDYIILQNGVATYHFPSLEVVTAHYLPRNVLEKAVDCMRHYIGTGMIQLVAFNHDKLFLVGETEPSAIVRADAATLETAITPISIEDFVQRIDLLKVMFLGEQQLLDQFIEAWPENIDTQVNPVRSQSIIMEWLPLGVSKASALEAVSEQLAVSPSHIMAIGDQLNDCEMIDFAGIGVAMGNAVEPLKSLATWITATNNESGVAGAFQHFGLIK